ncbi:MAG: (2Fe-2S)-binding protein [Lachnospiraceae bacterium]|nr:(2Fe-2S)-binding protein [Lachnospiraceae bacterium]
MAVQITIDDKVLQVEESMTILEAARENGIHIPTLCYLKQLDPHASCRLCVVEVEGARTFQPSCATKVREGMVVRTNTEKIRENRKLTLQMIMAHHPVDCHHCLRIGSSKEEDLDPKFCEMCFWCDCVRDGICELQKLNREYHVDKLPFAVEGYRYPIDDSLSVVRDPNKCVKCRRCVDVCNEVQSVHNLALYGRGQQMRVTAAMDKPMAESPCVRCGRCVDVCPTGALHMKESIDKMVFYAHSYEATTVGMVSTSLLGDLENLNNMAPGTLDVHKVIAGMKKIGVDHVISEEQAVTASCKAAEKIIGEGFAAGKGEGPVVLSNSYAVKNFVETQFPDLADKVNYYPSVQESFAVIAEALAKTLGWEKKLKTAVFTANNENGAQAAEKGTVDFSMNAREVYRLFRRTGVELSLMKPVDPLKLSIDQDFSYTAVTGPVEFNYDAEPEVFKINGRLAAVAHNLGQTAKLLEELRSGTCKYGLIRLSA